MGDYATRLIGGMTPQVHKLGAVEEQWSVSRSETEQLGLTDAGAGANIRVALAESSILYRFPGRRRQRSC